MDKKESIVETISAVTVSILTSGSVMTVVGFLMGYISTHGLLAQLGKFRIGTIFSDADCPVCPPGILCLWTESLLEEKLTTIKTRKRRIRKKNRR